MPQQSKKNTGMIIIRAFNFLSSISLVQAAQVTIVFYIVLGVFNIVLGVGFKVGGDTDKKYLVVQVHYMHPMKEPDHSGITILSTTEM